MLFYVCLFLNTFRFGADEINVTKETAEGEGEFNTYLIQISAEKLNSSGIYTFFLIFSFKYH